MDQPWIYMCSPSRSPLPHPSRSHPSGSSQYTRSEHLSHASILGWCSVSPLIVYLFQCYSLRTSHPSLLPESKSLSCTSVSLFSVLHIGLSLPSFYVAYTCVSILYCCLTFWLTSLCIMGSSFIHLIRTKSNEFFLMAE